MVRERESIIQERDQTIQFNGFVLCVERESEGIVIQTFMPYPDFAKSASVLDNRRLGKQRVECLQILKALSDSSYGWQNHPAVKMWKNCDKALAEYALTCCITWKDRGFKDTIYDTICLMLWRKEIGGNMWYPNWFGDERFHLSHRVALFVKDPEWYSRYFGWFDSDTINYYWPI